MYNFANLCRVITIFIVVTLATWTVYVKTFVQFQRAQTEAAAEPEQKTGAQQLAPAVNIM